MIKETQTRKETQAWKKKRDLFDWENVVSECWLSAGRVRKFRKKKRRREEALEPDFVHMVGQKPLDDGGCY